MTSPIPNNALHTGTVGTDAKHARLAMGGLIAVQGPGALDVRTGVLVGPGSTALLTGTPSTAPMKIAIAAHHWVTSRGAANGPYLGVLAAAGEVDIDPAPGSGTRVDVVWEKQEDATEGIPSPDEETRPFYGVTKGLVGQPKEPIPLGAQELGTVEVTAGATSTNGSNIVIANTARQTSARGARIHVHDQDERAELTAFKGLEVYRIDTGRVELCTAAGPPAVWSVLYDPSAKAPTLSGIELLRTTASGGNVSLTSGTVTSVTFAAGQVQLNRTGFYTSSGAIVATVPAGYGGLYLLGIDGQLDASIAGRFLVDININGVRQVRATGAGDGTVSTSRPVRLAAGDTIAVQAFQNSGATRTLEKCAITAHLVSL